MLKTSLCWDGHTHTEFCRHGSGNSTAGMVERAIECGFKIYSITEHAPLPEGLMGDRTFELELGLAYDEVNDYFKLIKDLKRIYQRKIEIRSGFEVDYLPGHEEYTRQLLREWDHELEEIVFSIHFMPGKGGVRCIDYTPEDFRDGLLTYYGDVRSIHQTYWEMMRMLIDLDLPFQKPVRLGHLALIYKFYDSFPLTAEHPFTIDFFSDMLKRIRQKGYTLDCNMAGCKQKLWGKPYLLPVLLEGARKYGIDWVYGSDAHGIDAVGHFYSQYQSLNTSF